MRPAAARAQAISPAPAASRLSASGTWTVRSRTIPAVPTRATGTSGACQMSCAKASILAAAGGRGGGGADGGATTAVAMACGAALGLGDPSSLLLLLVREHCSLRRRFDLLLGFLPF